MAITYIKKAEKTAFTGEDETRTKVSSILKDLEKYTYTNTKNRLHFSVKKPDEELPKIIRILSKSGHHIQSIEANSRLHRGLFNGVIDAASIPSQLNNEVTECTHVLKVFLLPVFNVIVPQNFMRIINAPVLQ